MEFYPNFALFSRLGEMNLDHDFVQVSKSSEDQKKGCHQKWTLFPQIQTKTKKKIFTKTGTLFSPISSGQLRSDAHQSQTVGADADLDHIQTIGWDTVKLLKNISPHPPHPPLPPPPPPGFGTPCLRKTNRCWLPWNDNGLLLWRKMLQKSSKIV